MLQLKNIEKSYTSGDFTQHALNGVSLEFRENEFVAVLGQSGSGKTTLLNIIGGLDRYDSGDLIINGKSTKQFKNTDWDAYRNNSVGFIFQSYNLIGHISVLQNVEMGMTLSGVPAGERKQKALEVLERVGLKEHAKKRPNQLSGGQMQRVAIARALANNPDIILADEPTGALDSETSLQIMDLIREIAKDKLVIMVTHNPNLATKYATRIVELKDGKLINDSKPISKDEKLSDENKFNLKKTAMSYFTALKLSFNNIMTKKGRTLLTAFASSIGIIGIALILSLSNGFDMQIDNFESETMSAFPITISTTSMEVNAEQMKAFRKEIMGTSENAFPDELELYPYDKEATTVLHKNNLSDDYVEYIERMDPSLLAGIMYTRMTGLNLMLRKDDKASILSTKDINFSVIPKKPESGKGVLEKNYDILLGNYPVSKNDIVLVVDKNNRLSNTVLNALDLDGEAEKIAFDDIIGLEIKLILNDDYYTELGEFYTVNKNLDDVYNSGNAVTLKISGIVRVKEDSSLPILREGIAYSSELVDFVIENSKNSNIVKKQTEVDFNVLTGEPIDMTTEEGEEKKTSMLTYLGGNGIPFMINVFPSDFDAKEDVLAYLDEYNAGKEDEDQIIYTDMAETFSSLSKDIMDAITVVLIAFSSISLVVSVIMIGIITYISVLERTKEIGVLRALGARKKDITRVFNAETGIIGICSGALGIFIAWLLIFPTNVIIENMTNVADVAQMNPLHAALLIIISVTLTIIGGFIPAKMASKKDPVVALRTE
ncbi:MAG: sulfate transporter ATP-binding protein [Clostridia bacterium]|nr:sulfate transporter ATP-binding protein [Clostridia bacterium]